MKLVKYECGCIGFEPDGHSEGPVIVDPCDREREDSMELTLCRRRGMEDKPYEPLNGLAQRNYYMKLQGLLEDGRRFREVRAALGIPVLERKVKTLDSDLDGLTKSFDGHS